MSDPEAKYIEALESRAKYLEAENVRLREECEIGARRNRTMEETIARLREELGRIRDHTNERDVSTANPSTATEDEMRDLAREALRRDQR